MRRNRISFVLSGVGRVRVSECVLCCVCGGVKWKWCVGYHLFSWSFRLSFSRVRVSGCVFCCVCGGVTLKWCVGYRIFSWYTVQRSGGSRSELFALIYQYHVGRIFPLGYVDTVYHTLWRV